MQVQPYVFFDGRCAEAIELYRRVLGAEVTMFMQFKESPDQAMVQPGTENKVMHAALRIGDTEIFASDGRCLGRPTFQGFSLSITAQSRAEAERIFDGLSEGGAVQMPLTKTFFAETFGMVADRFGVAWMVIVRPA